MSEADAVPLPREGEVFFDVRGEARCMRLSWYADSAIAVFSIWQGSRCTGTFRLPFKDLARMTDILQSGPDGPAVTGQPGYGHPDHGYPEREAAAQRGGIHAARRDPAPAYGGVHGGPAGGPGPSGSGSLPYEASRRHDVGQRHDLSQREAGYHGGEPMYGDISADHDRGSLPGYGDAPWQASTQALPRHSADRGYPAAAGYTANAGYQPGTSYPAEPGYPSGSYSPGADHEATGSRAASPVYAGHWMPAPTVPRDVPRTGGYDLESDWGSVG